MRSFVRFEFVQALEDLDTHSTGSACGTEDDKDPADKGRESEGNDGVGLLKKCFQLRLRMSFLFLLF